MSDELLSLVSLYGAPALFLVVLIAALGAPLPITLLLLVTGSLVSQGAINLWWAIGMVGAGSTIGDLTGYAIGRWGGPALVEKLTRRLGKHASVQAMEDKVRAWGGPGIFITRWLLTPLGPWVNLASGTMGLSWPRFLFWDSLGEFTGAALFIFLGRYFSDRVVALSGVLGDMTWTFAALLAAIVLGIRLVAFFRRRGDNRSAAAPSQHAQLE
jgi:membrane-associated protein